MTEKDPKLIPPEDSKGCVGTTDKRFLEGNFVEINADIINAGSGIGVTSLVLRPAADDTVEWAQEPNSGDHYEKVDEVTSDGDTTYIHTQKEYAVDTLGIYCKDGGTLYKYLQDGFESDEYILLSKTLTKQPSTNISWTKASIGAARFGVGKYNTESETDVVDVFECDNTDIPDNAVIAGIKIWVEAKIYTESETDNKYFRATRIWLDVICNNQYLTIHANNIEVGTQPNINFTSEDGTVTIVATEDEEGEKVTVDLSNPIESTVIQSVILRPNGDDAGCGGFTKYPDETTYYEKVDEEVADDDTTYIKGLTPAHDYDISIYSYDPNDTRLLDVYWSDYLDTYVDFDDPFSGSPSQSDIDDLQIGIIGQSVAPPTAILNFETWTIPANATIIKLRVHFRAKTVGVGTDTYFTQVYVEIFYYYPLATQGGVQDQSYIYKATTGSANAYILTLDPAITAYATGQKFCIKANHTNTGESTLNVNGQGATDIKKNGRDALIAGDIVENKVYDVVYDGTNFQLLNPSKPSHTGFSDIGTNTHAQIDTFIGTKAQASGLASLNASSKVVQNPANATATPTASKIVIADGSGKVDGWVSDSSTSVKGKVECAIISEVTTGTSETLAVTPDALAGSTIFGRKAISIECFSMGDSEDNATGDGKGYCVIPECMNGMNLVRAQAIVRTAGTEVSVTEDIQIHNVTDGQDMLSTRIALASGATVGTVGVIDAAKDDVVTNDVLRVDVDTIHSTAAKGLIVILEFQLG